MNSDEGTVCDVDVTLISVDGKFTKSEQMLFHENELIEDASE